MSRCFRALFLAAALLAVLAGSWAFLPQSAVASPTHRTTAAANSPVGAVTALIQPFTVKNSAAACNALTGKLSVCPLTARLRTRLQSARENANLVCRCQNPPLKTMVWLYSASSAKAYVEVLWYYGTTWYPMVWVVVKQQNRWLADDQYCTGRPTTTVYSRPAGPCS